MPERGIARGMLPARRWLVGALLALGACGAPVRRPTRIVDEAAPISDAIAEPLPLEAQAWPEATARFHTNGAWVGADSAYSIEVDSTHVLWLFADTFIDPAADGHRENGPNYLIRNSVAIQSGSNPSRSHDLSQCTLQFYWGPNRAGQPTSFFHESNDSEHWVWPLHGARMPDGKLLLFRMHVAKEQGGLGFRVNSWDAVAIDDPDMTPHSWRPRVLTGENHTFGKLVGSSVLTHEAFLYAYAVDNQDRAHTMYLARWPLIELSGLTVRALDDPQWWTCNGFVKQSALPEGITPAPLFTNGQVELSVHYDTRHEHFVEIQMQGQFLGDKSTQIGLRTAPRPEGPWSKVTPLSRPIEGTFSNAADLAAYAAKAHPEQRGADLVLTYVVNDLKQFPPMDSVYYPKVLRVGASRARCIGQ